MSEQEPSWRPFEPSKEAVEAASWNLLRAERDADHRDSYYPVSERPIFPGEKESYRFSIGWNPTSCTMCMDRGLVHCGHWPK